jgi:hypothetical protein
MVDVLNKILDWWAGLKRSVDTDITWPLIKVRHETLEGARHEFWTHVCADPAWLRLGLDEAHKRIEALK